MWLSQLPENDHLKTQHAVYCGRCRLIGAMRDDDGSAYCPRCGYVGAVGDDRRYK